MTGRVISPTDSTAIWTPAGAKDPITARALEKSKVRQGHLKPDTTSHLSLLLLGPFRPPCTLICAQVRMSVSPPVPSQPQGSPDVPEGSLLAAHPLALLSPAWQVRASLFSVSAWGRTNKGDCVCARPGLPHQTASGHTDVQSAWLAQRPILDLLSVTDIEAEATGTAVQFTALGALN